MWLPLLGLLIGLFVGLQFPLTIPVAYAKYTSVALLAAMDSVLGGIRAGLEGNFDQQIFFSGFVTNSILAGLFALLGDRLGVELHLAAIFAFGVRIFQNLAIIRRIMLKK